VAPQPALLVAAAGRPRARRSGAALGARLTVASNPNRAAARLRLLEGFLQRTSVADCAQYALGWLNEVGGVARSLCLLRAGGESSLYTVAVCGFPRASAMAFSISLEDWSNPLVTAIVNRRETHFGAVQGVTDRRRRPATPFEDAPFRAIPLGVSGFADEPLGLLLVADATRSSNDDAWFAGALGQKLDQLLRHEAISDGDRRQGRERSLLYSIINAVTDPILLTDTEGRLLIANTRALTLFTASEEESEGRRGAVRMNNMLLSSALSSKAIEEIGAARRELLLVNPADGSDLLFELLSTVTEDPRHGTGVVSILRNVSDLRRASEELEENYRKLRVAEVQARAESDRLNLIIDSVADPIVVTDAEGQTSLMNEPAERLYALAARERRPAAARAVKRRAFLLVHHRHARQRRSAARRRDRPVGSDDRRGDAGRSDRRQDRVGAWRAHRCRDDPARSPGSD